MAIDTTITLTFELSGKKAVRLMWTLSAEYNLNYEVFWKSDVPAGQNFVLLGTTNAKEYTTAELENSKTYSFYIRGWYGEQFFYSNTIDLFVSCGKGVALAAEESDAPPCQLAVVGRLPFSTITPTISGYVENIVQDPVNKNKFYFMERVSLTPNVYRVYSITWGSTAATLITEINDWRISTSFVMSNSSIIPAIAWDPYSSAYHLAYKFTGYAGGSSYNNGFVDINLSTGTVYKTTNTGGGGFGIYSSGEIVYSYVLAGLLYFCSVGVEHAGFHSVTYGIVQAAGSTTSVLMQIFPGAVSVGIIFPGPTAGTMIVDSATWQKVDIYNNTKEDYTITKPPYINIVANMFAMNVYSTGYNRFRFVKGVGDEDPLYFMRFNTNQSGDYEYFEVDDGSSTGDQVYPWNSYDLYNKTSYWIITYSSSRYGNMLYVGKMITDPQLVIYGKRSIQVDDNAPSTAKAKVYAAFQSYPYIYVYHISGANGVCLTKICNGVG